VSSPGNLTVSRFHTPAGASGAESGLCHGSSDVMLVGMDALDPRRRFPATAPLISVEASKARLGPIDCQELQWWFAIPRLGDRTAWAAYDVDNGEVGFAHEVVSTAPVGVDGRDAIELLFSEWSRNRDGERTAIDRFTCVLDDNRARWLMVTLDADGDARTLTKGDPEFDAGWAGTGPRRLVDSGRYQQLADGSYRLTGTSHMGAGVYRVSIGPRVFTCLRVMDLIPFGDESAELGVAFVAPGGRTVLYREYSTSTLWDDWQAWRAAHPGREIVINDSLFLQRDCTGRAHDVITTTSMDTSRAHALLEP
jgi:hypothetical protein